MERKGLGLWLSQVSSEPSVYVEVAAFQRLSLRRRSRRTVDTIGRTTGELAS